MNNRQDLIGTRIKAMGIKRLDQILTPGNRVTKKMLNEIQGITFAYTNDPESTPNYKRLLNKLKYSNTDNLLVIHYTIHTSEFRGTLLDLFNSRFIYGNKNVKLTALICPRLHLIA